MTLPIVCVLVAFGLIYLARILVVVGQMRMPEGFDNHNPRDQQARLQGWARRANAAHQNSFEAFAPFAAAVILALVTGVDPRWRDALCLTFVVARAIYLPSYVGNIHWLRSLIWTVGLLATTGLFLLPLLAGK